MRFLGKIESKDRTGASGHCERLVDEAQWKQPNMSISTAIVMYSHAIERRVRYWKYKGM